MLLTSLFVGLLPDLADGVGLTIVTLVRGHVLDTAVAELSVVPINKAIDPGSHREKIPESPLWITLVVLHCAELRIGTGIINANPWPGERQQNSQFGHLCGQGVGTDRGAAV